MVPKIPQGMKCPIEGSFETLVALQHFSQAGEHTKHASVLYLLPFFFSLWIQCIRAALNPGRGERAPLGNVQDAMEKNKNKNLRFSVLTESLVPSTQVAAWR